MLGAPGFLVVMLTTPGATARTIGATDALSAEGSAPATAADPAAAVAAMTAAVSAEFIFLRVSFRMFRFSPCM
jgi:hypothetical protein